MDPFRPQNIVVFSAGESEKNGNLGKLREFLNMAGHSCHGWRELFSHARNENKIALLPMLLKKIPTFDFAIILGDGVDVLGEFRNEATQLRIMRDNVLFEAGLCIMALGATRVILLIENDIRIPEDFGGIENGGLVLKDVGPLGVEYLEYANEKKGDLESKLEQVLDYIGKHSKELYPVVVGAAISTAEGYFTNFVLRFWESIGTGFRDAGGADPALTIPDPAKIKMKILIPKEIYGELSREIPAYYEREGYRRGIIPVGEIRGVEFRYRQEDDGSLTVCDIPSTVTASYGIVVDILQLDADEEKDQRAEERFLAKELDSFVKTLRKLMVAEKIEAKERRFVRDGPEKEEKIRKIVDGVMGIEIGEVDLMGLREQSPHDR